MKYFSLTDMGLKRENNEDNFFSVVENNENKNIGIFAVADGMGGYENGQYASGKATEIVKNSMVNFFKNIDFDKLTDEDIKNISSESIKNANKQIYESSKVMAPMGTTFVMVIIIDYKLFAINAGDSRVYLYNSQNLMQITKDNSYVQYLLEKGMITEDQAKNHEDKNKITRAVGFEESIDVDFYVRALEHKDKILLCSDGLTTMVDDEKIKMILSTEDVKINCENLISIANYNGGRDNITVTVIEID